MKTSLVMVSPGLGGLQQSVIPYGAALRAQGHEVQMILHRASPLAARARALGFAPQLVRGPHEWPLLQWAAARRAMREFAPDAVIGFAAKGLPLALLAAPAGVPVLSRVGSMDAARIKALLAADGLIVTSEEMRRLAVSLGAKAAEVVPNFLTPMEALPRERGEVPRIGAMGRFVPRKGFDLLIEAAGLLKARGLSFELVLAGEGPELDALRRLAAARGVAAAFPGWLSGEAKARFLARLDVFACPSRDEPFGQIFLEAMQAGVPVAASETVGTRAIFTHGQNGLISEAGDAKGLADSLAALLGDAELRGRIAASASAHFHAQYSVEAAGRKLSEAVERLVRSRR